MNFACESKENSIIKGKGKILQILEYWAIKVWTTQYKVGLCIATSHPYLTDERHNTTILPTYPIKVSTPTPSPIKPQRPHHLQII